MPIFAAEFLLRVETMLIDDPAIADGVYLLLTDRRVLIVEREAFAGLQRHATQQSPTQFCLS